MRTRLTAAALAAAALLALTACSSSSSDDKAAPTPAAATSSTAALAAPTTTPATDDDKTALKAAVHAYSDAYFNGDTKAAGALLSERCRTQIDATQYATAIQAAAAIYGHLDIKTLTVDQLAGTLARVTYTYPVSKLDQHAQPWTREHGRWHYDAC